MSIYSLGHVFFRMPSEMETSELAPFPFTSLGTPVIQLSFSLYWRSNTGLRGIYNFDLHSKADLRPRKTL